MKLVVALALLSNAAAFMAPVQPKAAMQPLKAITTEVSSRVRNAKPSYSCTLPDAVDARSSRREECGCPLAIDARRNNHTVTKHRP